MNKENYESFLQNIKIFQKAVENSQERHKRMGLYNVYSINEKIVYEMANGKYLEKLGEQEWLMGI